MTQHILIKTKTGLNRGKKVDSWFQSRYAASPYRGCEHNCLYCDGRSSKYWRSGIWEGQNKTYSSKIFVKENIVELFEKTVSGMKSSSKEPIFISSGTSDAYQPAEKMYKFTRQILKICLKYNFPVHILTKSDLVLRDIDILEKFAEKNIWHSVSFSFSTSDDTLAKEIESRASLPSAKLAAIKKLTERGIYSGVYFMPILPVLWDKEEQLAESIKLIKESGAKFCRCSGMTLTDIDKELYFNYVKKKFPDKARELGRIYKGCWPDSKYSKRLHNICKRITSRVGINTHIRKFRHKEVQKSLSRF